MGSVILTDLRPAYVDLLSGAFAVLVCSLRQVRIFWLMIVLRKGVKRKARDNRASS